jgi:hypothetical protein
VDAHKGEDDEKSFYSSEEAFAGRLVDVIYGGQVVLSETSWSAIQDQLPGHSQARPPVPPPVLCTILPCGSAHACAARVSLGPSELNGWGCRRPCEGWVMPQNN